MTNRRLLAFSCSFLGILLLSHPHIAAEPQQLKTDISQPLSGVTFSPPGAKTATADATVQLDVTDILGNDLPSRLELQPANRRGEISIIIEAPNGHAEGAISAGAYKAFVYVYIENTPLLVEVQDVTPTSNQITNVLVNLLEGATEEMPLWRFDRDYDLAIDRVELSAGTNPDDPTDFPGRERLPFDLAPVSKEPGWYKGQFHACSKHGYGVESVAQLIKRAEDADLDFLAITDRNTMAAALDPEFKSNKVVLIPAMEWGNEKQGVALILGPRTIPEQTTSRAHAQAIARLVQAQGGAYIVAHPLFGDAPWQWGLSHVNGVEVWCRDFLAVPPLTLKQIGEEFAVSKKGRLIESMGIAAATEGLSANGQASLFYDLELVRGLQACVIGGSRSASPKTSIASPITYVFAPEKSVRGILDGVLHGSTFVSNSVSGPRIVFRADAGSRGDFSTAMGGVIPMGIETTFEVAVQNAKGKTLQVLYNGRPLVSKDVEGETFGMTFAQTPTSYSVFRVRVVEPAKDNAFGPLNVLAMSSPIYAQERLIGDPDKTWLRVKKDPSANNPASATPAPLDPTGG